MGTYDRKDHFYKKAKSSGYRSRAAFKLEELDKRVSLFRKGDRVLDMGCYPGGWLQMAQKKVGPAGSVSGFDIQAVDPLEGVTILQGDVLEPEFRANLIEKVGLVDVLLSDMSPSLTGVRFRDVARAVELVEMGLQLAEDILNVGAKFVAKVFPGAEADQIYCDMQKSFSKVKRVNLKSTRRTSSEMYFVGLGFRARKDSARQ